MVEILILLIKIIVWNSEYVSFLENSLQGSIASTEAEKIDPTIERKKWQSFMTGFVKVDVSISVDWLTVL